MSTLPLSISFCSLSLSSLHHGFTVGASAMVECRNGRREDEGGGYKTVSFFSIWWVCACARTNSVMSYVCSLIPTNFSGNSGTCFHVAENSATHLCCRKISNASALQKIQQRICVAENSATHLRCRARRWNSWVLNQVHPCCRKISNADALLIFLQHGKQVPEFPEKFVGIKLHT